MEQLALLTLKLKLILPRDRFTADHAIDVAAVGSPGQL
jgi:hypothetical protein